MSPKPLVNHGSILRAKKNTPNDLARAPRRRLNPPQLEVQPTRGKSSLRTLYPGQPESPQAYPTEMMILRVLLAFSVSLLLSFGQAWACSCAEYVPIPCKKPRKNMIVFLGTVADIEILEPSESEEVGDFVRYHFRIDDALFGVQGTTVDVLGVRGGMLGGYVFEKGEQYLVFPHRRDDGVLFSSSCCSRTQHARFAGELVAQLRSLRDKEPVSAVFGILKRTPQPYNSVWDKDYRAPVPHTTLHLKNSKRTYTTLTNEQGGFNFDKIPPGRYTFSADLPPDLELVHTISSAPFPPFRVEAKVCLEHNLTALPTGSIRGRVLGPDGNVLPSGLVSLFRVENFGDGTRGWNESQERKGFFEYENVAPGEYILVFNAERRPDPDSPYPRTFYPNGASLSSAKHIRLESGQMVKDADIHVGDPIPTREFIVRVRREDGQDLYDGVFVTSKSGRSWLQNGESLGSGIYKFTLLLNSTYTFYGRHYCEPPKRRKERNSVYRLETDHVPVDGADLETKAITLTFSGNGCSDEK